MDAAELRLALNHAIGTLPTVQREVIELAFFHGTSHAGVSERLGVPLGDDGSAAAQERWDLAYRFRTADGDWVRVAGQAMLVRDPAGLPVATQGAVVDVT